MVQSPSAFTLDDHYQTAPTSSKAGCGLNVTIIAGVSEAVFGPVAAEVVRAQPSGSAGRSALGL